MGYPNEIAYQRLSKQLKIDHRTRITGRVTYQDAPRYLALGDIAVAPKRTQTEANGKIYNYMATGLPTVAFDTVVNRNILGDIGVYTNPAQDYPGLAQAIVRLLDDPDGARAIAGKARVKAVARYSWDHVADRIIAAYQRVILPWQIQVFRVSIRKQAKWRWLKRNLASQLTADVACLDIGCGVGILSHLQEKIGGRWTFLETDAGAARQTEEIVRGQVIVSDIYHPSLQPGTYDVITILDVIEHLSDPEPFMRRVHELLAPGGRAFITTPSQEPRFYLFRFLADKLFAIDQAAHGHTRDGFSRLELTKLFLSSDLKIVRLSRFSKVFTEFIELSYNAAYKTLNKSSRTSAGYNLALSPANHHDFNRHKKFMPFLIAVHPVLLNLSRLDEFLPDRLGYEWGIEVRKSL
jgi:2-polyprenyl-3-methyl-5-hydroxy-6-metoxy-1,4-benzoquinol methylase